MNNDMLPVGTTVHINPEDIKWDGGDLISRSALKEVFNGYHSGIGSQPKFTLGACLQLIDNAPAIESVQMDLHEKILDQTISELFKCQEELENVRNEKRPQGERCRMNNIYVLLDKMRSSIISMDLSYSQTTELLDQILEIEKAVDNEEKPHGEWIMIKNSDGNLKCYKCSHCGKCQGYISNYCEDCGADMQKGDAE